MDERKIFSYPPFVEMAVIEYRDKSPDKALNFLSQIKLKLDTLNSENLYDIEMSAKAMKRNNDYIYKIFVKGNNIRDFLSNIKKEIFRN
jgi:primosomal protein N'